MPITMNQVPPALSTLGQMLNEINTLVNLLNEAEILANQNWVVTLSPGITITVDASQQAALIAQYDTLKNALATSFNQLP